MDSTKYGLMGLVFVCLCLALALLAFATGKGTEDAKKKPTKAPPTDRPTVEKMASGNAPKLKADATPDTPPARQSRLGVPPPGEIRIEGVAPRTIGRGKL